MDALAAHAEAVKTVGFEFAKTGQAIDTTWQGLAAVYQAPEAAALFAATGPVRMVSASVGEDIESVGRALTTYAIEVKEIKAQLAALKSRAEEFVDSIHGDKDWRDDEEAVDRHNGLISAVNTQVAAFFEAQRRCANTITPCTAGGSTGPTTVTARSMTASAATPPTCSTRRPVRRAYCPVGECGEARPLAAVLSPFLPASIDAWRRR
jgi:hypothetical protein